MLGRLRYLYRFRRQLFQGVHQDLKRRYVGSVLGTAWVVLFPLVQLSIYALLYSVIFQIKPQGFTRASYVLHVFSGLVPLLAFNEALHAAVSSLATHKELALHSLFPPELLAVRAVLAAQLMGVSGLLMTLTLGLTLGQTAAWPVLLLPVFWLLLMMLALGLGWILSLLALVAQDVQHVVNLLMMIFFLLSPFGYTSDMVPTNMRAFIYLNPLSYFVLTFQALVSGRLPEGPAAVGAAALSVLMFLLGFQVFRRAKSVFFDHA